METPAYLATCNLSGGGTVEFEAPWPERSDTVWVNPVEVFLKIMYTADETDPD